MSGINIDDWPDCTIPGCPNKCCLRLNSEKCWPHTVGAPLDHASTEIEREIYEIGVDMVAPGSRDYGVEQIVDISTNQVVAVRIVAQAMNYERTISYERRRAANDAR